MTNDLEVHSLATCERADDDIARDAVARIKSELHYAWENIPVFVENGWLTLEGEVQWNYQRERAEDGVRYIPGVKGVTNSIDIRPRVVPTEIHRRIEEAFQCAAEIAASGVTVETSRETILREAVRSWAQRQ